MASHESTTNNEQKPPKHTARLAPQIAWHFYVLCLFTLCLFLVAQPQQIASYKLQSRLANYFVSLHSAISSEMMFAIYSISICA